MTIRLIVIVAVLVCISGCAQSRPVPPLSQADAQALLNQEVLADFRRDVDGYMALHDKLQRQGTPQIQRSDIGENLVSSQALATRIRQARRDAEQGDILAPPIARAIRVTLNPALRSIAGGETRRRIRDDGAVTFELRVNGDYPDGESRSTMPGNLLAILPPLPSGLEYRIVDTHLVLMDVDANLVVDYLRDVMCATC
jgi:hypothetical protein